MICGIAPMCNKKFHVYLDYVNLEATSKKTFLQTMNHFRPLARHNHHRNAQDLNEFAQYLCVNMIYFSNFTAVLRMG